MLRHAIAPRRFFLQVPNDIIRHPRLGSDAKALLLYVLSLPTAADEPLQRSAEKAGLKKAAFSAAKRQLLAEGYLHEWREQGTGGRWGTAQLISNVPLSQEEAARARRGEPVSAPVTTPEQMPAPSRRIPAAGEPGPRAVGRSQKQHPVGKTSNRPPSPPSPEPAPAPEARDQNLVQLAGAVLASVSHREPRLQLGGRDIARLAPLGAEWLARGCPPDTMRLALATGLPSEPVHNPAGFLRDRLRRKLPLPAAPALPAPEAVPECDTCRDPLPRGHRGAVCEPCATSESVAPAPAPAALSGLAAVRAALGGRLAPALALP